MRSKDLGHLICPFFLFPLLLFSYNTLIPLSLSLSHLSLSLMLLLSSSSLSPNWPSCPSAPRSSPSCLPSPNEKPHNNTGHRSRERTGCIHNRPVAPRKTIISFFSSSLSTPLPGLEKTNLCRGSWRGGKSSWSTASEAPSPLYKCLKDHNDKHTCTHQLLLSPLHLCTIPPLSLFIFKSHHVIQHDHKSQNGHFCP